MYKLLVLTPIIFLTACMGKVSNSTTQDAKQQLSQQNVAVLTDVCLTQKTTSYNRLLAPNSQAAAQHMTNLLVQQLQQKNVPITQAVSHYSCGFVTRKSPVPIGRAKAGAIDINGTPYYSPSAYQLPIEIQPFLKLSKSVFSGTHVADEHRFMKLNSQYKQTFLGINHDEAAKLKSYFGTSKLLMLQAYGQAPTTEQRIATTALGLLTQSGLGDSAGQYYVLSLVDLDTQRILWTKYDKFKGDLYKNDTVSFDIPDLLDPLF